MKRLISLLGVCAIFLSGCSLWSSTYVTVTPSSGRSSGFSAGTAPAENYEMLLTELEALVASGAESGVIYTVNIEQEALEEYMASAVAVVQRENPVGAYALEKISWEIGNNSGKMAAAVSLRYRHSAMEVRKILHVADMTEAEKAVREALEDVKSRVVMRIAHYAPLDADQLVQRIGRTYPEIVMELPEVAEEVYGTGEARVLELSFLYENSRDSLRYMRTQVEPVFNSAELYISSEATDYQKYAQLHTFLMDRSEYTYETSLTPAYSLLHHGVGDSKAFATVYAAMCRRVGLNCMVVTGTRGGEPWTWNMIYDSGRYYHVDLLRQGEKYAFEELLDDQMAGYVWDFSAYPACDGQEAIPPETIPEPIPDATEESTQPPEYYFEDLWEEMFGS